MKSYVWVGCLLSKALGLTTVIFSFPWSLFHLLLGLSSGQEEECRKLVVSLQKNILLLSEKLNVSAKFGDAAEACNQLIILMSFFLMFVTFPFSLLFAIKWTQVEKCYKELFSLLLTYNIQNMS